MKRLSWALLLLAVPCLGEKLDPRVRQAAEKITGAALSAHIRFLADDLLEGRGTGTRGEAVAQRYVAARFAADGIEPGAGGSYFDRVTMRGATIASGASLGFSSGAAETPIGDFVALADGRTTRVDVSGPAVFVGYGIVAPEYHYDDLGDFDLHGKIAVVLIGSPASERADFFPATARDRYADFAGKLERLRRLGAVGVIVVVTPESEKIFPWARRVSFLRSEKLFWRDGDDLDSSPEGVVLRAAMPSSTLARLAAAGGVPAEAIARTPAGPSRPPVPSASRSTGAGARSSATPSRRTWWASSAATTPSSPASMWCTPRISITSASARLPAATRSTTAPGTTARAWLRCWRWRAPSRASSRGARSCSWPPPARRSASWAPRTSSPIRRSIARRSSPI
jgi:hypothetical protein